MTILGVVAGVFALLLLVLPTLRVMQGRLSPHMALGLWVSGAGFLLLALAALVLSGDDARTATLLGVAAAVAGNVIQRKRSQPREPGRGA
ncbi:MAG TPA: hypothetical protein VK929_03995 [Longimicrobiales bacterium]|nr:hypothetical protein [Longimicrobiales bacterium]